MKVQTNTIDVAIANATGLDIFSADLFVLCNEVDAKFETAPENVFIGNEGRFYDKKVAFSYGFDSYVAEVIVRITAETQEVRNTYTVGYNIYKLA